jgi:NAD(P)H-flavin reductase
MPVEFKKAKVVKKELLASSYFDIVLETLETFDFVAGQFITIKVKEGLVRSYSIAGRVKNNQFGLMVDIKPGGEGSIFFKNLEVGDEVSYVGPAGAFTLKEDDGASEVVFMGTGSGITPLKAMIEQALYVRPINKKMTLYFGLRYKDDLFWNDYFDSMAARFENFTFKLCLSKPEEGWQGASGHITDLLFNDYSDDTSTLGAYLCGNGKMIEEAKEYLMSKGTPENRIYHEKFF